MIEITLIPRYIFVPDLGRECPFTDALIKDGERRLSSRFLGIITDPETVRRDYIINAQERDPWITR